MKKKRIRVKKGRLFATILICFLLFVSVSLYLLSLEKENGKFNFNDKEQPVSYDEYFHDSVKTLKTKKLYQVRDEKMTEVGSLLEDINLELQKDDYAKEGYFQIKDTSYYINYEDIEESKNENVLAKKETYQNYIPFNESFKTSEKTEFYQNDKLIFTLNEGLELPILIKETNYYGVLFNNKLYYLKKESGEVINANNTTLKHTDSIATLVYHFVYDVNDQEEMKTCKSWNETICLSSTLFKEHMTYLKENNFYTATMEDLSLFIDGKIQLPEKTVVITIDDGYFTKASTKILEELELHATLFLIGVVGKPEDYVSPSLEIHSHSYDLHNTGVCPGGQGSPLKCLAKDKLLEDLKKSRESLNGSTVFCYPFFEYNDYAISVLKEAGFEMAFIGGRRKITVGANKYTLPRYGVINTTWVSDIAKIVN